MRYIFIALVLVQMTIIVSSLPYPVDHLFRRSVNEQCIPRTVYIEVKKHNCQIKKEKVPLKQCTGVCMGIDHPAMPSRSKCTCCEPTKTREVPVPLTCKQKGKWVTASYGIYEHISCSCLPCSST